MTFHLRKLSEEEVDSEDGDDASPLLENVEPKGCDRATMLCDDLNLRSGESLCHVSLSFNNQSNPRYSF